MGYELVLKLKFIGCGRYKGIECSIEMTDLCDDGSDPETQLFVTKEKDST